MAEKSLEFEAGVAGDNVTAGSGNVSGLNTVANGTGGITKYDPASAFFGSLGITITNGAGSNATSREFIDAPGTTVATSDTKMAYAIAVTLPSTVPTETETFWEGRLVSGGGPRISYYTDGTIKIASPVAGGGTFTLLTSAERAALPGRQLLVNMSFDATSGITTCAFTGKVYDNTRTAVSTPQSGTINFASSSSMAGHGVGRIIGVTAARAYGFDHMALNNGSLAEIPMPSTRLTTPTVTLGEIINPTTTSGTNGQVTVTWGAISGAVRYDVYKAAAADGAPAQGDFVLLASDVTSPYIFTGLKAGRVQLGVKAVA